LKEPPKDAICASFVNSEQQEDKISWDYVSDDFETELLNNLSEATNNEEEKLVPMRSYMIKYKKREGLFFFFSSNSIENCLIPIF
jgi:hypothetical protein